MKIQFSKASFKKPFLALMVFLLAASASASHGRSTTKHIQVLINTGDPSFKFVINDGVGLHYGNPFYPRPFGSNYVLNGLLFPGGTVDVTQVDYRVDRNGIPLTAANSIGHWQCVGNVLVDLLTLPNVPPQPTNAELITWTFFFKTGDRGNPNNIYTSGVATTGVLATNQPLFNVINSIIGGTGPNDDMDHNLTAQVYFQPATGCLLISITFDRNVKY